MFTVDSFVFRPKILSRFFMNKTRVYFHHLDVIRFFAAFCIFFGHGFQAWEGYFSKSKEEIPFYIKNFTINMGLGVELFFFISGFLITYILLKEKRETGQIAIGKFFVRRALRIWPLYFLLIAVTPLIISWMDESSPNYLAQLFFIGNFDIIAAHSFKYPFSHFWSIAVEEQFYLIWPFVIAFVARKRLLFVFLLIIIASIISRYMVFNYWQHTFNIYYNTLCRMDTLVIGAVFAYIFESRHISFRLKPWMLLFLYGILVCLLFFTLSISWPTLVAVLFKKYLYLIPLVPLTLHYISAINQKVDSKIHGWLSYLGKSSYGLYMIHNMLILIVVKKIMLNNSIEEGWVFWLVYTLMTFIIVVFSFEFYEKPFLKLKERFSVVRTRKFFSE